MWFLLKKKKSPEVKQSLKGLAHFKSGIVFFNRGRFQDARFQFEKALAQDPDYVPTLCMLGRCYFELEEKDLALPLLEKGVEQQPDDTIAHYVLGLIYYDKSKFHYAVASFKNALKVNTDISRTVSIHDALARSYRELGDIENAIKECQAALVHEPNQEKIHGLMGELYFKKGDFVQAIQHLEKADPYSISNQENLSQTLWEVNERERAVSVLQNTIKLFPNEAHLYSLLGYYFVEMKKYEEAIAPLHRALEIAKTLDEKVAFNLGEAYYQAKYLDKALEVYVQAIELFPKNAFFYRRIGFIYQEQNNLDAALQVWRRMVEVNYTDVDSHRTLALGLRLSGDFKAALEEINRAISLDPSCASTYTSEGTILLDMGRQKDAITSFEKAIDLGDDWARLDLAEIYHDLGNEKEAVRHARAFIEAARGNLELEANVKDAMTILNTYNANKSSIA